jgi:hypothetical protein
VGCCRMTNAGITVDECYYMGTASTLQTACQADGDVWSTTP